MMWPAVVPQGGVALAKDVPVREPAGRAGRCLASCRRLASPLLHIYACCLTINTTVKVPRVRNHHRLGFGFVLGFLKRFFWKPE